MSASVNSSSRVTIDSMLTQVSSKPIGSGKTHTLSSLDQAMGFHTVHIIYYYHDQENLFGSFDLNPLRVSLSEALTLYPTMTGRLAPADHKDGNWIVKCNDAGLRVLKANVDTTLLEWLTFASGIQEMHLVAWDHMPHHDPNTWSPFRIQINCFQGGGVAIGLSCNHMLADLTFAASFFKSWTETYCNLPITHPPFFTPLILPNTKPINNKYSPLPTTTSSKSMARATFKFSNSIIKECLSKVHAMCPNATPFDFLSALFWTRIVLFKLKSAPKSTFSDHDLEQIHSLSICTDFRSLLKSPLPIGYFGNALHFSMLSLKLKQILKVHSSTDDDELGGIASLVHGHVAGLKEEDVWSQIEWFDKSSQNESEGGKFRSSNKKCMYGPELTCVCMEHMMEAEDESSLLYGAMFFNDEKPIHVSCHVGNVEGEGLIMVMPSPEGGLARTVMVMLPEEQQLAQLTNDIKILQLDPTIILAGIAND